MIDPWPFWMAVKVDARSSPRPWRISPDSDQGVVDADGRLIFVAMSADAALIVAAVNAYGVELLERARDALELACEVAGRTSAEDVSEWTRRYDQRGVKRMAPVVVTLPCGAPERHRPGCICGTL